MTDKQKKTFLLYENSDLNVSEHDLALDYDALKGIISAKRDYKDAEKNNDYVAMKKANLKAENIRRNFGYTGGESGSGYYKEAKPEKYTSKYQSEIDDLYDKVINKKEFTYDAEDDPIYQIYKKIYVKAGEDAYDRSLAENSLRTGGLASSSAISAASQAQAYYNNKLAEMIPKLYESAYLRYQNDIEADYNKINMLRLQEESDYKRYKDTLDEYYNERDFYTNLDNIELENAYRKQRDEKEDSMWQLEYEFDLSRAKAEDEKWKTEFDYQKERDSIEDAQWQKNYNLSASRAANSASATAIKNAQWEKEFKLDAIKAYADIEELISETGMEFDKDILKDLIKGID